MKRPFYFNTLVGAKPERLGRWRLSWALVVMPFIMTAGQNV